MDSVLSPLDLTAREAPDGPVAIARPHRVHAAATWFRANFPGDVFYAVKANTVPRRPELLLMKSA
jgi:ornithine decarboxylase